MQSEGLRPEAPGGRYVSVRKLKKGPINSVKELGWLT